MTTRAVSPWRPGSRGPRLGARVRTLALTLAVLATWASATAATAAGPARTEGPPKLEDEIEMLVRLGEDHPGEALQRLHGLKPAAEDAPAGRHWRLALGLVQARDGRVPGAEASARWLEEAAQRLGDPLARADAELVRGVLAEVQGRLSAAADHAQAAHEGYERYCGPRQPQPHARCDYRPRWRALQLAAHGAVSRGLDAEQRRHAQAALDLARQHRDVHRELRSLYTLATSTARSGSPDEAARLLAQGERLAQVEGSPELLARVRHGQAWVAAFRQDIPGALRLLDEALGLARQAGARRLEALILTTQSDELVRAGRPREALRAIEQALPIVRGLRERVMERTLLHNASLARLGLKQVAQARRDFDQLLVLWQDGGQGDQAEVLREFSDALAEAGDPAGALQLYHRERHLAAEVMARSREVALRDLQQRYDGEKQQRHIELLERDNAIKSAQIANRELLQRVWTLLAATLAVAAAFAVLLYLRVRETQRQLERSQAALRVQSERDALTGLANRRRFQETMREHGSQAAFQGALLLVDIDHFKHVNDRHGHAAGDEVLVEVAHRVQDAVRSDDLVVRWGGEEFLIYAPGLTGEPLKALAERLLRSIDERPIHAHGRTLRVTASIGHAAFPLAPHGLQLTWERALNFVDMALYTAKSQGRHRAVGITGVQAADLESLKAIEDDFETAWTDGRVSGTVSVGR